MKNLFKYLFEVMKVTSSAITIVKFVLSLF